MTDFRKALLDRLMPECNICAMDLPSESYRLYHLKSEHDGKPSRNGGVFSSILSTPVAPWVDEEMKREMRYHS